MKYPLFFQVVKAVVLAGSLWAFAPHTVAAPEAEVPAEGQAVTARSQDLAPELMRSFLHLQEQLHATQLAVERSRIEADAAALRNNEALNKRLELLESALDNASQANSTAVTAANLQIQKSNSQTMMFAGIFVLMGFLALALTGWMQWKTVSHLTGVPLVAGFPGRLPREATPLQFGSQSGDAASVRLSDALGKLEHRIAEVEETSHEATPSTAAHAASAQTSLRSGAAGSRPQGEVELSALIEEGEGLLAGEDPQKAIEHFDAILEKHPAHAEVLLHKGTALERLHRDQEAIECYDRAIRADKDLTMAYLHKGGLFNRLERFSEAMECYEQALRIQEGRPAA
jgi:tetratricopeptide (TPR) repeat protein